MHCLKMCVILPDHDNGNTWRVIHGKLNDLGYDLLPDPVIFSPHYIGIPQHRERVFIMCVRKDVGKICPVEWNDMSITDCSIETILQDDTDITNIADYRISPEMESLIDLWNEFLQNIKVQKLPGFPIWSDRLKDLDPAEDLNQYPKWKINFILKNNALYEANRDFIDSWLTKANNNPLFFGAKQNLNGKPDRRNLRISGTRFSNCVLLESE